MSIFDFFRRTKSVPIDVELQNRQIRRLVEILKDCEDLINNSKSPQVVASRCDMAVKTIDKLLDFSDSDIEMAGFKFGKPLSDIRSDIIRSRNTLIYQSNHKSELDSDTVIETDYETHTIYTIKQSADGMCEVSCDNDEFTSDFFELSAFIDNSKNPVQARLQACEKAYALLPEFCRYCIQTDGELPPLINCRDFGPEYYMRLGEWDKAEKAIKQCIAANAYYPDDGSAELADFESYRIVAETALSHIRDNPGILQRNIYKALGFEDEQREQLKHFLCCSQQIKKEKYSGTNKLFCIDEM